jgi:hypothetical protein
LLLACGRFLICHSSDVHIITHVWCDSHCKKIYVNTIGESGDEIDFSDNIGCGDDSPRPLWFATTFRVNGNGRKCKRFFQG